MREYTEHANQPHPFRARQHSLRTHCTNIVHKSSTVAITENGVSVIYNKYGSVLLPSLAPPLIRVGVNDVGGACSEKECVSRVTL